MPLNYSVQPSTLSNSNNDVLARYQVSYGEPTVTYSLGVNFPYDSVSTSLSEGRPVVFVDGSDAPYFSIIPSIAGSTLLATPATPTMDQVNVGFRPSPAFLSSVREKTNFNRVESSARIPNVFIVNEQYLDEKAENTISVNGGHSDYIEIVGINLRPIGNNVTISLNDGTDTVALATNKAQLITWTQSRIAFNTKAALVTPAASGTLEVDVDGKTTTFPVTITDRT